MHMALAAGSVPVALAALSSEVYGQAPTAQVTSVLQFALLLENLEAEFYKTVTAGGAASAPPTTRRRRRSPRSARRSRRSRTQRRSSPR
jgi:hypothetical protein